MSDRESAIARVPSPGGAVPAASNPSSIVTLGNIATIDLAALPEAQRLELMKQHAAGVLEIGRKAQELSVDVGALRATLDVASKTAEDASAAGNAVTITHSVHSKAGRTEVMIGNTTAAQAGKLSARQAGVKDWTPYYVFGGLLAAVLIAALFVR